MGAFCLLHAFLRSGNNTPPAPQFWPSAPEKSPQIFPSMVRAGAAHSAQDTFYTVLLCMTPPPAQDTVCL